MLALVHPALLAVALATVDSRAYEGPVAVDAPPAPEPGSWPASAGRAPGAKDMSKKPDPRAEGPGQDMSPKPGTGTQVPGSAPTGSPPAIGSPPTGSPTAPSPPTGSPPPPAPATGSPPTTGSPPAPLPGAEAKGVEREVRYIEVTTDMLGRSTRLDVQRHAGGRAIVDVRKAVENGAASMTEMLDKVPGVRAVEGNSGLATSATKLNVAVRGANPRLSEQATVMLDEVPIAPAPYGAPSLSLFPLSLFQIARVDTVRGGASVRFGPWTTGGVFNLVSHPIPVNPTIAVTGQTDQFGDSGVAGSYGGTHGKLGMYFEYAPRFGKTYRQNSEFQSHGGILKFAYPITPRLGIESSTHLFWEKSRLPGALVTDDYNVDRFQSVRPFDRFDGHREASNLKVRWKPRTDHELQVIGFYSHTFRRSVMATNEDRNVSMDNTLLTVQPRVFDVLGIEPRYALRIRHKKLFQDLTFGARGVYEWSKIRETWSRDVTRPATYLGNARECLREGSADRLATRCLDGRTAGFSLYAEDKLYLLDMRLVITAGIRGEIMQQGFFDVLNHRAVPRPLQGGPLPALSVWYGNDQVAGFAGYGRSFGAPSYFSGSITIPNADSARGYIKPELADMVEGGLKVMELGGVYADVTGWYKYFRYLRDEGDNALQVIPAAHAYGVEAEVEWLPGEVWERVEGLEMTAGYAYTGSRVLKDLYTGNVVPWYPVHEAWGRASYKFPVGLKFGASVDYTGKQFTDYGNITQWATGELGVMPAYTLMGAFVGMQAALPRDWRIEFTVGAKNLLDHVWFSRSDDLNGGILGMRPRTFYLNLGFAHEFVRGRKGEQARGKAASGPNRKRWTAGERRQLRALQRVYGAWL